MSDHELPKPSPDSDTSPANDGEVEQPELETAVDSPDRDASASSEEKSSVADPAPSEPAESLEQTEDDEVSVAEDDATQDEATEDSDAPAVVAVLVATNPGACFAEALASLAAQDYANFSVLVVDAAGGDDLADQVAEVLPTAFIHRVTGDPGFSAAANQAMTLISGAAFLMFCHDDVALDARCTSALVEEIYRSNAGIVSPKVVQWDDRRRLQQIGRTSDRFGVQVDLVEPNEFDQEQYDSVRDVFVAPSGVQLIRADLFAVLGGFDLVMPGKGEDLDLCWRAHVAGARVLAVPAARARHMDNHSELGDLDQQRQMVSRHRLRTLLVVSSPSSLVQYLPLALLILAAETLYCVMTGRRKQAAGALKAVSWNVARLDEIRQRRAQVASTRKVSDREVRSLQIGGSARISEFFGRQFGTRQDRLTAMVGSVRDSFSDKDSKVERDGMVLAAIVALVVLIGSRDLSSSGILAIGQMPSLPSAGALLDEWSGGWRSAGLGGPGNSPLSYFVFGIVKGALFFSTGLINWIILVGPLVAGAIGMFRLLRPFDSLRASSLASLAYVLNPVVVLGFASGRWDALVIFALCPTLLGATLRLQGIAPFGLSAGLPGPGVVDRDLPVRLVRLGLCVTLLSIFVPAAVPIAIVVIAAIAVGSIVVARPHGNTRLVLGAVVAVVVPVSLQLPWASDIARGFSWEWLVGPASPATTFDSLADLIRFAPNGDPSRLMIGLLCAAGVSLTIARGRRFDVAVLGWSVAAAFWFILWAERRGFLGIAIPAPELMLVPAAAGLALAVGVGARSVEVDLQTHSYGWRQIGVAAGGVGLAAFCLLGLSRVADGRWDAPTHAYSSFTAQLDAQVDGEARILWLADPSVSPVSTQESAGGVHFGITDGAEPTVLNQFVSDGYGATAEVGKRLDLAADGETVRLGRLLGHYGIDFVVVLDRLAPAPYQGPIVSADNDPARGVVLALEDQLDLHRLTGMPNFVVYRNGSSSGPAVSLPGIELVGTDPAEQLRVDAGDGERLDLKLDSVGHWVGHDISSESLWLAVAGDGWVSNTPGTSLSQTAGGMIFLQSESGALGEVDLSYAKRGYRRIALLAQMILLVAAVLVAQSRRGDA